MNENATRTSAGMPHRAAAVQAVTGVRMMTDHGGFSEPTRVAWAGGTFTLRGEAQSGDLSGDGLYLLPGLVDAHAHVSWHAFNESDRLKDSQPEQDQATIGVLHTMLRAGFTSVRDAGGLDLNLLPSASGTELPALSGNGVPLPRVHTSGASIGRVQADAAGGVVAAVEAQLDRGAQWVKLIGTASVASPPGAGLEPVFTAAEQSAVVDMAAERGAGVMLHAWGGPAIDHAIDAGVLSIEHGIFLTPAQAVRAAARGMTLVPTLKIYRLVRDMIEGGLLPKAFSRRVAEAVAAHPDAVRVARDAGLAVALGTDFSTPEQHGTNRTEFDELVRAGLSAEEALVAATRSGAELLARATGSATSHIPGPADSSISPSGRIAHGHVADAVLLNRDPRSPGAFSAPGSVIGVVLGGEFVDLAQGTF